MKLSLRQLPLLLWSAPAALFVDVQTDLLFHQRSIHIQRAVFVYVLVCTALIAGLFLAVVTVVPSVSSAIWPSPPLFSSLLFPTPSSLLSLSPFLKGLLELRFNFYTFSPRTLQIPGQLPLITPLQITHPPLSLCLSFSLYSSSLWIPLSPSLSGGLRGIIA